MYIQTLSSQRLTCVGISEQTFQKHRLCNDDDCETSVKTLFRDYDCTRQQLSLDCVQFQFILDDRTKLHVDKDDRCQEKPRHRYARVRFFKDGSTPQCFWDGDKQFHADERLADIDPRIIAFRIRKSRLDDIFREHNTSREIVWDDLTGFIRSIKYDRRFYPQIPFEIL